MTEYTPYGSWPSAIDSSLLTAKTVRLSQPQLDSGHCYWLEQRPEEKGRCVVVCQKIDNHGDINTTCPAFEVTPPEMSVHTKAQEYGGGGYCVKNGVVYFVNASDQRVYKIKAEPSVRQTALPLSPEGNYRYADFFIDQQREQLICICERHSKTDKHQEPENSIISLRLDGSSTIGFNILVFGNDFYSNPSVSPDGDKLTWLTWNHPNMPWDNSECWIADFNNTGMLHKHRKVAGGEGSGNTGDKGESVFQPQWSPTGDLIFVSDRNNWWNLYSYNTYNKYTELLLDMPAEFATPQWVFGMSTYGFLNSYTLFCTYTQDGQWFLGTLDLMTHTFTKVESEFTDIEAIACQDDQDTALFIGANDNKFPSIIHWQKQACQTITQSSTAAIDDNDLSAPATIIFQNNQAQEVYGFFYHPKNKNCQAAPEDKPPLIVMCHGGPTGSTKSSLNLKIQYWTNRGFAVFDINYSGSTGYGREYRHRLYQQWGIADVNDLCTGAKHLVAQGQVDPEKIIIRGSSAGGYSVLAALTFHDTFKAGASLYGIGDLSALAEDTHKFESRYCDQLIGPYPEQKTLYQQRSPIHHIDQLNCPAIFLQGQEDKVVPPNQAEAMVEALHQKNIPVAYVSFDNEGHGFRQAENIRYSIDVEYAFYCSVFDLIAPTTLPSVPFYQGSET